VTAICITVPGEVRGKGRPRAVRRGGAIRMYTDSATVSYENLIGWTGAQAMAGADPLEGPLCVTIDARFLPPKSATRSAREGMLNGQIPPAKRPDCDNICKAVLDGLNGVAWCDDAQVVSLYIRKRYCDAAGLDITIRPFLIPAPIEAVAA
jgi:Holliday junction resolvase RusA-like endonuclease